MILENPITDLLATYRSKFNVMLINAIMFLIIINKI